MWISYTDSEVSCFHPICEKALNLALKLLGREGEYRVLHHQYTGSLEMDYVVQNRITGKYLCVIEVKRTPADVHSTRYQFQAMSYVQMNAGETEVPFYILTNLEYAFAFRYDAGRPKVFQQMLKPGLAHIGSFVEDTEEEFVRKLAGYFMERLQEYCNNRYEYLITLEQFVEHMERVKGNRRRWKSHLAMLLYEYIRGAFDFIGRKELPDIRLFRNDVEKVCREAARVNFKEIFSYSAEEFEETAQVDGDILRQIYDFGNQNISGESVAGILHQMVSAGHEHEGEVPTDLELGRLVAELAKYVNGNLEEGELLCDPAAGSGNLIDSAVDVFGLKPKQILANDSNEKLLEPLSLRLGLCFARTVGKDNSPAVFCQNAAGLPVSFFENVRVIVMNPPFVAGINCVERKQEFYHKLAMLVGSAEGDVVTNAGQMPLEAVFLELITRLVKPGTTISCVFPKTHLTARGLEAQRIRRLLLDNLGLRVIFTYPGNAIFDDVVKDTCVVVGKAMQLKAVQPKAMQLKAMQLKAVQPSGYIDVVTSYEKIPDLDNRRFAQAMAGEFSDGFCPVMPGVVARRASYEELEKDVEDGWRFLNSEMTDAIAFVEEYLKSSPRLKPLSALGYPIKRGAAGNSGGSDLVFFDSRDELFRAFVDERVALKAGMRNAKLDSFVIDGGDSRFLDISANAADIVERIVDAYMALPMRQGKQQRKEKSREKWMEILRKESKGEFRTGSVLIPRTIRRKGRVYLSEEPVFVSTNLFVCTPPSYEQTLLLSTWMSTIFYQLLCEVSSKDQEGARKMERSDILHTLVPDLGWGFGLSRVSDLDCVLDSNPVSGLNQVFADTVSRLEKEKRHLTFLDLQKPKVREVDRIWAEVLFGERAEELLEQAARLLDFLANRRNT